MTNHFVDREKQCFQIWNNGSLMAFCCNNKRLWQIMNKIYFIEEILYFHGVRALCLQA